MACADALVTSNAGRIGTLASGARLPTRGSMSYGPRYPDLFRRTAELVDKILRGAKPGDIPVEQPTKLRRVINQRNPGLPLQIGGLHAAC
jgi:putative ABC transport system substrate-binding protein